MSYKVCSSEKLRKAGADAETKAMLYLMNFREDSSEMNYLSNLIVWNSKKLCNKEGVFMEKFNSLTPDVLEKIELVYTKALDYAFDNKDIKIFTWCK